MTRQISFLMNGFCFFDEILMNGSKKKGTNRPQTLMNTGRSCRIRTYDQRIKSPLLYQLS
jgi:hypothetical protein